MSGTVLVTGAAGYIGSHAVKALLASGRRVVGLDSLVRSSERAVAAIKRLPGAERFEFVQGDIADVPLVIETLRAHTCTQAIHFAAFAYVGESVERPLPYYVNNTAGSLKFIEACVEAGVHRFVYSSTCATYGEPDPSLIPINETCPQVPINPYGWSKLFIERALEDVVGRIKADGGRLGVTMLRYFNVAGCDPEGLVGEDHTPETHIIPIVLQAAMGIRDHVTIFGDDYATPDGTCVRDYVHVTDLVQAHLLAMDAIRDHDVKKYNLGIGRGYSVREIIDAVQRVTGKTFAVRIGARRPGDPPTLMSDASLARRELDWVPQYAELDQIIKSAWDWFSAHPEGYEETA